MDIKQFLQEQEQPSFRLKQFNQAYYQELITDLKQISTWPQALRSLASNKININPLRHLQTLRSSDNQTHKALFARAQFPEQLIETVLMQHADGRNTVCVSCMVGCPMNCQFCATGKMGFIANLSAEEIVEQVLYFTRDLKTRGQKVTNVVFMGMGEPLINLQATQQAIVVLTDPKRLAMSPTRITVSTCGVTPALKKFIADGYKGRLAISLHAPNQLLREQIMPVAKNHPLDELLAVVDVYTRTTHQRVSYEYILINQVNDHLEEAQQLAELLGKRLAHVNLIPYNPVPGKDWQRPSRNRIFAFARALENKQIAHTIRVTMGDDIQAACGQLATQSPKTINP